MRRRELIAFLGGTAALSALPRAAAALDYPTRPVHWIVGFPPGGATDIIARLMGQWLSERLGQSFVIDNRPGAGSNIGTEAVAHAPADGYTLLLISELISPRSNAASHRAESRSPLCTSRRCASAQSAHGTMWEARSSAGSVMPVIGQRPPPAAAARIKSMLSVVQRSSNWIFTPDIHPRFCSSSLSACMRFWIS